MKNTYLFILIVLFFISISLPTASSRLSSKLSSLDAIQKKKHRVGTPKTIQEKLVGKKSIVYYMGDIHGDFDKALKALVHIGFLKEVDSVYTWQTNVKEDEHDVYFGQTGDLVDRGPHSQLIIELFHKDGDRTFTYKAQEKWGSAAKDTDRQITIKGTVLRERMLRTLGNHETEPLVGRFTGGRPASAYQADPTPMLQCDGDARKLLKGTPVARMFGDTIFLHGGISEHWMLYAQRYVLPDVKVTVDCTDTSTIDVCTISGNKEIRAINEMAMSFLWNPDNRHCAIDGTAITKYKLTPETERTFYDKNNAADNYQGNELEVDVSVFRRVTGNQASPTDCPVWFRRWGEIMKAPTEEKWASNTREFKAVLAGINGAKRMVIGHEIIKTGPYVAYEGTLIGIDVGMSTSYDQGSGMLSLLKIEYDAEKSKKISTVKWDKVKKMDDVPTITQVWTAG